MAKKNINQAEQTATNVAEQTNNVKRTRAEISEGAKLKRAEEEQKRKERAVLRADISNTSSLWSACHNSINSAVRSLIEVCAEDARTLARVAWIAGVEESNVQDTRDFRRVYIHAVRALAPIANAEGVPLYRVQVAEDVFVYSAECARFTARGIFSDPLLVKLGAKKRITRAEGVYYRKDGSEVRAEIAEREIEDYQRVKEALAEVAKDARAKKRAEIDAERNGARK